MSIQQQKKQSDLEKRLQILRRQVYGKNEKINYQAGKQTTAAATSDLAFLRQDLLKILTFSSLAIGAQIILKLSFF